MFKPIFKPKLQPLFRFRRIFVLSLIVALLLIASVLLWQNHWLDFSALQAHRAEVAAWVVTYPITAAVLFFAIFVAAVSLSLPVATVLALLAGSLFGFAEALLLVAFASSVGAMFAMLLSRYVFRDLVERHWPHGVAMANRGLARDGSFYLLFLRISPALPYFVVNLLMGLTRLPVRTFFVMTLIGTLPEMALFVNAGGALATLQSPADVLTGKIILSLVLLSLLPLLIRYLLRRYQGSHHETSW
jgi:uncharacterized membrane protein YdjX (TVP38/TMEM64 family)